MLLLGVAVSVLLYINERCFAEGTGRPSGRRGSWFGHMFCCQSTFDRDARGLVPCMGTPVSLRATPLCESTPVMCLPLRFIFPIGAA